MKKIFFTLALITATLSLNAQFNINNVAWWIPSSTTAQTQKAVLIVYYPIANCAYVWGYSFDNKNNDVTVEQMMYDIEAADKNLTIDIAGGMLNEITYMGYSSEDEIIKNPDPSAYGYWMYNVNDVSAQLGVSSQTIEDGDVVLWEYKTDWSCWDCTSILALQVINYVTDPNAQPTPIETIPFENNNIDGPQTMQAMKLIQNGQIFIMKNGIKYTITGQPLIE